MKIAVIGSDARYEYAVRELRGYGFDVTLRAERDAGAVLMPINQTGDAMLSDLAKICPYAVFFGGAATDDARRAVGGRYFDLTAHDGFADENARLTAEGALGIMIREMPFSVHGARVYVLGYGKVGRALVDALVSLGACVTVFARRKTARTEAGKICRALDFSDYTPDFDCLINTVPSTALTDRQRDGIGDGSYVLELASAPGGFSDGDRGKLGARYIKAPGLPGKCAPMSAGKIMAKAIYDIIKGEKIK